VAGATVDVLEEHLDRGDPEPTRHLDVATAALVVGRDGDTRSTDLTNEVLGDIRQRGVGLAAGDQLEDVVLVGELVLGGALVGDVARDGDDGRPVGIAEVVVEVEGHEARQTIGGAHPYLAGAAGARCRHEALPTPTDLRDVPGIEELEERPAAPRVRGVPDRDVVLHRGAEDAALCVEERDVLVEVLQRGVIEQGVWGHGPAPGGSRLIRRSI
jgi:hypothetical protein